MGSLILLFDTLSNVSSRKARSFVLEERIYDNDVMNPNWHKLFVFQLLEANGIDYDQICLVDSSFMYKWDAPNFFELTDNRFTAWRDTDNLRWIYDSIQGYKDFFDGFEFDTSKYVNSGFIIFNKKHREFFQSFKKLYYDNVDRLVELQDKIVIKGTEQTPFNYWLQVNEIDVNIDLPIWLDKNTTKIKNN